MTDEKVQVIQSDSLKAQLLSKKIKSLTIEMNQPEMSDLLVFYFKFVFLPIFTILKQFNLNFDQLKNAFVK